MNNTRESIPIVEPGEIRFRNDDKIPLCQLIQTAKINGKSKDYIAHRIRRLGCPSGKKNCWLCSGGNRGSSLNKGKGRTKKTRIYLDDY